MNYYDYCYVYKKLPKKNRVFKIHRVRNCEKCAKKEKIDQDNFDELKWEKGEL